MNILEMQDQHHSVKSDIIKYLALKDGQDFSDWTLVDLFDYYTREIATRARKAKEETTYDTDIENIIGAAKKEYDLDISKEQVLFVLRLYVDNWNEIRDSIDGAEEAMS